MKKRHMLLLAGLLAASIAATGCGSKKDENKDAQVITATPTPEVTKPAENLVNMQAATEEDNIKNVIGEKTASAEKFVITNDMGSDIASIYIRQNTDEDDEDTWGTDLVSGKFILKDGDKAVYYYAPGNLVKSDSQTAQSSSSYDIRIAFTDEERNECFFRKIPLATIKQITLCMDETEEYSIPYAKYLSNTGTQEVSTLDEVKKRLGISSDGSYSDDSEDKEEQDTENSDNSGQDTEGDSEQDSQNDQQSDDQDGQQSDGNGQEDSSGQNESDNGSGDGSQGSEMISQAKNCIGKSLDELISTCGQPQGQDYQDEPETGKTGYHYYSNFTVSTTVDENGNEIVAGVW